MNLTTNHEKMLTFTLYTNNHIHFASNIYHKSLQDKYLYKITCAS
jgi:hypothetical protein